MKQIVIVGGGFAGVAAGLQLKKNLDSAEAEITLIDKNPYHLFTPSLYEVATSEVPQKNIAIPLNKIFEQGVKLLRGEVALIDPKTNSVTLKDKTQVSFDYLLVAVGSEAAYMGIPGLQQHSVAFKSLRDAVEIKNQIKNMCCKEGKCDRKVQVIIGGGGFAGTELAAELLSYKDKIAVQNALDRNCLELTIIQGSDKLLKELNKHVSDLATQRLTFPNVHLAFGGHIKEVTSSQVLTDDGKAYPYHILIWTGGVTPNHLAKENNLSVNDHGGIKVNEYLQMEGFGHIFAVGDVATFLDPKTQKPIPQVAQIAEEQGAIAGENIAHLVKNKPLKKYHPRHFGYIVPIGGRFAVAELEFGIHFDGFLGWCLQQLVLLRYLLGILPFPKALKRWNIFELELEQ